MEYISESFIYYIKKTKRGEDSMKGQMLMDYNEWFKEGMQVELVSYDEFGALGQYVYVRNELNQVMPIQKSAIEWF